VVPLATAIAEGDRGRMEMNLSPSCLFLAQTETFRKDSEHEQRHY